MPINVCLKGSKMLLPITREQIITADNLASIREYYEFRRQGDGYNYDGTALHSIVSSLYQVNLISKSNIFFGMLFEICLFKGIVDTLVQKIIKENDYQHSYNKNEYIRQRLISIGFSHEIAIGRYDEGYDFLLKNNNTGDLRIDAKVYGTKIINSPQSCSNFNLYVDEEQYRRHGCDTYIQGFIINQSNHLSFYVAGWKHRSENFTYFPNAKNPAYGVKVTNLNNIGGLIDLIYQNNSQLANGNPFDIF